MAKKVTDESIIEIIESIIFNSGFNDQEDRDRDMESDFNDVDQAIGYIEEFCGITGVWDEWEDDQVLILANTLNDMDIGN